jgi:hypothetical protein
MIDRSEALSWVSRLVALAILADTIELWSIRGIVDRIWARSPLRRGFVVLLVLRLSLAIGLGISPALPLAPALFGLSLLVSIRFGGSFNGGSDAMLAQVLIGLSIAALGEPGVGLTWIAVQVLLSYVLAGIGKLRQSRWRSGESLKALLAVAKYGAPAWARRLSLRAARPLARLVIGAECAAPVLLVGPRAAVIGLGLGLGFHAANAGILGLNRFLWVWIAGYPAVLWVATTL